jgi:hypothetical protein
MRKNPRLFNVIICAAILSSVPALAAEPVESPSIKSGDSWIYRSTTEKGRAGSTQTRQEIVVTRVTSSSVYWTTKEPGSTQVPKEFISPADWSRARSVNGQETVVNKPLAFPLSPGQKWDLSYSEDHPNRVHKSEQWHSKYTVVGFEPVEVPAGKFNALKIEAEGNWVAQLEPTVAVAQGAGIGQCNNDGDAVEKDIRQHRDWTFLQGFLVCSRGETLGQIHRRILWLRW